MRRLNLLRVPLVVIVVLLFLTGQSGPPQPFSVFGVSPESLAPDGIAVYPPDGTPTITAAEAEKVARGERLRGDALMGVELVHLKHDFYPLFDGLAWILAFDMAGKPAVWPGDSQLPEGTSFLYTFDLVFIDAFTGDFLFRLAESSQPFEPTLGS